MVMDMHRFCPRRPGLFFLLRGLGVLLIVLCSVPMDAAEGGSAGRTVSLLGAQTPPSPPRRTPGFQRTVGSSKEQPAPSATKNKGGATASSLSENPPRGEATPADAEPAPESGPPTTEGGSSLDKVVQFIRGHATWIIAILGLVFAAILIWILLGLRSAKRDDKTVLADLGLDEASSPKPAAVGPHKRFSSTKIQAADVNTGLARAVKTTEVETDREYALVVDEEALKMPPLPEEARGKREQGDASKIQKLLDAKKNAEAYDEYARHIQANASLEFPLDLERLLAERLIQSRDFEKAVRVLEHHVATHEEKDIRTDTYFNLGYLHFMNRTLNKSRRYFKRFIELEKNPAYVERAHRILEKLEKTPS